MNRLFIAAEIPQEILSQVIGYRDRLNGRERFSWEPAFKLHLTLHFIGDTDTEKTTELVNGLSTLQSIKPVPTAFTGFDAFYRNKRPSIVFAQLDKTTELSNLYNNFSSFLNSLSITTDKKEFHPHLTLLRVKEFHDVSKLSGLLSVNVQPMSFFIQEITLFKSVLLPGGSKYSKLHTLHLT